MRSGLRDRHQHERVAAGFRLRYFQRDPKMTVEPRRSAEPSTGVSTSPPPYATSSAKAQFRGDPARASPPRRRPWTKRNGPRNGQKTTGGNDPEVRQVLAHLLVGAAAVTRLFRRLKGFPGECHHRGVEDDDDQGPKPPHDVFRDFVRAGGPFPIDPSAKDREVHLVRMLHSV